MKKSPLQVVKDSFQSREALVEKLAGMVDDLAGDGNVKSRLQGLSNGKLLRLYRVEQTVREKFGDREKLVDHIVSLRKKAGQTADDAYRAKLATYSKARLLDVTNQNVGERPAKLTPEQKLANKRGRKERERAASKLAGR
jgi:hypothetical protein